MVTKKQPASTNKNAKSTIRQILNASDTSSTVPNQKQTRNNSHTIIVENFENPETHQISSLNNQYKNQSFGITKWLKENWEILSLFGGLIVSGIIFFTKLDTRVTNSEKDIDTLKINSEKSTAEQIRSTTRLDQIQSSVTRIEDRLLNKK